ncbi:hypothetical protein ARMGADRAFT_1067354 [Armillaria gallica]|uniref:Uncharacterized protein n=1 Tax=Armillaria gallica TaxID=47427 RepID=A0A2H3CNK6_ARMGA|nr:hypothetical protein ARMGADRAFT_1067354 [Armillaria gallica]
MAVLSYRLVPRQSRCRYSSHDDNTGKSRENSSFWALVGIGGACETILSRQMPHSDVLSSVSFWTFSILNAVADVSPLKDKTSGRNEGNCLRREGVFSADLLISNTFAEDLYCPTPRYGLRVHSVRVTPLALSIISKISLAHRQLVDMSYKKPVFRITNYRLASTYLTNIGLDCKKNRLPKTPADEILRISTSTTLSLDHQRIIMHPNTEIIHCPRLRRAREEERPLNLKNDNALPNASLRWLTQLR